MVRANRAKRDCPVILENGQSQHQKQGNQSLFWCFTFNNYTEEEIEQIELVFKIECDWYVFQEEMGEEGTPHLQGTFKLKDRKRLTELKKIIVGDPHLEITKKVPNSIVYCCKATKRIPNGRIFSQGVDLPDCAEPLDLTEPWGWQLEVMNILSQKPHPRHIYWFWEPVGGVGKTDLCKYLVVKHKATLITGKSADIFNAVKNATSRKIFVCNIPKSCQDFINYGALEAVKDGLLHSGKYEGGQVVFNRPHVFVFCNQPPDMSKMSEDKFVIKKIQPNMSIPEATLIEEEIDFDDTDDTWVRVLRC